MADTAASPLRILTLSTLFPSRTAPLTGLFVARQTAALNQLPHTEVRVVAPIGRPIWPFSAHPRYRAGAENPYFESWDGLSVWRPRFLHWPGSDGRFSVGALTRALMPLLGHIRQEFPFDIIDAQYFFPDGPAAVAIGKELGLPVSIKARGSDIHYWARRPAPGRAIRHAAHEADGLLAVSVALRNDMTLLGMPATKIGVHYTGVDLDLFYPRDQHEAQAQLGVEGPLILSIGALIPRKQPALLLKALTNLQNARLVFIGDGPEKPRLMAQADQFGLTGRVIWKGALSPADIALWLAAANVMALASASEGLANAWLEALACGRPIVITPVGGAQELLTDPRAGKIVAPNPNAAAIAYFIDAPPTPEICRNLAMRFTWTQNAQALRDHLSALAGKGFANTFSA